MAVPTVDGSSNETAAIDKLAQHAFNVKSTAEVSVTLTCAEFMNGLYIQTGTPGACNKTTPTATAIVAAIPEAVVGTEFEFVLDNGGDNTITLLAGTGVTLSGTATCATTKNKTFRGFITNVGTPAVRVICGPQLA